MIVDFDDFSEHNHQIELLLSLKVANPKLRVTLFAVPGLGSPKWWAWAHALLGEWCEFVPHGWVHPDPYECSEWTTPRMFEAMNEIIEINGETDRQVFQLGFKAPGWQISDGCYAALNAADWWVADQPYNDERRPHGLRVHLLSPTASSGDDPEHWHGHIQNVCGNGLQETFLKLEQRVKEADSFQLVSEAVKRW